MKFTIKDIDVFITTHNRAPLLAETIESVLANTIVPDRIIVLDNESTDNTEQVCRLYENKNVVYIKTFGKYGNFYKSKEIASRKYLIRLHDDNLINCHFFEKILFMLNKYKNISIASMSYRLFFTGYPKSFPYLDITDKIKNFYSKRPLGKDIVLINNDKEYMVELIKKYTDRTLPKIGGTPFHVEKTEVFKDYQPQTEKYGKADDVAIFLFALKHGRYVYLNDTDSAFFRAHPNRDSETDENSLDLNQVENLVSLYTKPFKNDTDPEIWKGFFCLFYGIFPTFLKNGLRKEYPNKALLEHLFKRGILPPFVADFYNEDEVLRNVNKINIDQRKVYESYLSVKKNALQNVFWDNISGIERIFSVKNFTKNGIKRKYLILFNHRIYLGKVKNKKKDPS